MYATEIVMPSGIFSFVGQSRIDVFSFGLDETPIDLSRYDDVAVHGLRLAMEAVRVRAEEFSFWQRRRRVGRPSHQERTLLIAFLLQQLFDLTFRQTEGLLHMVKDHYGIGSVPDHSTMCRTLGSERWSTVLDRFFGHMLAPLPRRRAVLATDATGYSGRKRSWREAPHASKAREDWVKVHAAVEVDEFIVLSYSLTRSNVHESRMFEEVWHELPDNVQPIRSLADSAYFGNDCLAAARRRGAAAQDQFEREGLQGAGDALPEARELREALADALRRAHREAQPRRDGVQHDRKAARISAEVPDEEKSKK
jgi:hypothetical protein